MWIDPNDPERMIVGNDGGIAITWDGGGNYDFAGDLPIGQFYDVSYDMAVPYNVCGGAQDNGSWCGPSRRKDGPMTNAYWFTFAGGDGFLTAQDPTDPNIIYAESQGGNISRVNIKTGERTSLLKPTWRPRYAQCEDSIIVVRGDTATPATRDQQTRIAAVPLAAEGRLGRAGHPLELEHAVLPLAAQPGRVLRRGQPRAEVDAARRQPATRSRPICRRSRWRRSTRA